MGDEELKQIEKRREYLEQIKQLFFEYGVKNLNMDEISRKLGISKKTLYSFVKSKEDLLEQIFINEEQNWIDLIKSFVDKRIDAIEQLMVISVRMYHESRKVNHAIRFELRKYYESVFDRHMDRKRQFIHEGMTRNMQQGIREGLYRSDINIDLVATIYLNNLIEVHDMKVCEKMAIDFFSLFEVMIENHIRGIATPTGIEKFENLKDEIVNKIKNNEL